MAPSREAWAEAFARQARSDWRVYQHLSGADPRYEACSTEVETCHCLHFLQMACEKIAKAYRIRDLDTSFEDLSRHHTGFASFVNAFLSSPTFKNEFRGRAAQLQALKSSMRHLASEIECIAPAINRDARPDNAEYPWQDGDQALVPCDYTFPNLNLRDTPNGRRLLSLVRRALDEFERVRIT